MKLNITKSIIIFIIIVLLALSFCACNATNPAKTAEAFLNAIAEQDFALAYTYTWPYDNTTLEEEAFIKKYTAIFDGLGIQEMQMSNPFVTTDSFGTLYTYTATYITKDYGTFIYDFTMEIKNIDATNYVDWNQNLIFPFMALEDKLFVETLPAVRGEIFTKKGDLLAKNDYGLAVYMDVTKIKNIMDVSRELTDTLGVSEGTLIETFNKTLALNQALGKNNIGLISTYPLNHFTKEEQTFILSVAGIGIDTEIYAPIRYYPYKEYMAHILGYIGPITEDYLAAHPNEGYTIDSKVGKTGLESKYEAELKGKSGLIVYVSDKWGNQKEVLYEKPAEQGKDFVLTIVLSKQIEAYNLLKDKTYDGQNGVAIVMDAKTGAVEAMVSYPSYDNNIFSFAIPTETWEALNQLDANEPLYDRATLGLYPPGSLLKPFTIIPALEQDKITKFSAFNGTIINNQWLPDRGDWNSPPITRVSDTGTPLRLSNAMVFSDNIYFAWTALKVGAEGMVSFLSDIGFAKPFNFDTAVKTSNIINEDREIYARLLADMGYGQGQLLLTPIQMASLFSAYANGTGDSIKPQLVAAVKQSQGTKHVLLQTLTPTVEIPNLMENSTYNTIIPLLKQVITSGTGRRVWMEDVAIAGKTGTAEVGSSKSHEISWFAGFWTQGSYDRLVLVMLESRANGGREKFTIAKELLKP